MFNIESIRIGAWLADLNDIRLVLSIASGNRAMRETHQPFIKKNILDPLEVKAIRCIHHELHPGDGVDLAGDLFDTTVQSKVIELKPDLILCCNLFEHVIDRSNLAHILSLAVPKSCYLLLTVPRSFQYHADPIDTYFRPTPLELSLLFPEFKTIHSQVIKVESMIDDLRGGYRLGTLASNLVRHFLRLITLLPQRQRWLSHLHSTLWLFRSRQVTMLLLQRF